MLFDNGAALAERLQPPVERPRKGASWDEARAHLIGNAEAFDNAQWVAAAKVYSVEVLR